MYRISVDWADEIVDGTILMSRLEKVFGPFSEDTDWHWAAFEVPEELGGGWVPCGWTEAEEVLMELDADLCDDFDDDRIREVFRELNPDLSDSELDRLREVGQEILDRSAYHKLTPDSMNDDWACSIATNVAWVPLQTIFGPVSEDPDWDWVAFEVPEQFGGGWFPCAWNFSTTLLSELNQFEKFSSESKIREVFRKMNPDFSDAQLKRLRVIGQEILHQADGHRIALPAGFMPARFITLERENDNDKEKIPTRTPPKTPGMER